MTASGPYADLTGPWHILIVTGGIAAGHTNDYVLNKMSDLYARNPKVEMAPMKDETVLFNPANNKFCVLNTTAAFIWETLVQPRTREEIAAAVAAHFANVDLAQADRDVGVALAELGGIECVQYQQ